jgi:hypothetical protein
MFHDRLNFILWNQVMNALSKVRQNFRGFFLSRVHIFLKRSVKWQHYQLMPPNDSRYQTHVQNFVGKLYSFLVHQVKHFLSKILRIVNQVDWHEFGSLSDDLFFSDPSFGSSLLLKNFFLFVFCVSSDTFFPLDLRRIDKIILIIAGLDGFKGFSGGDEKITGNESDFGRGIKASISDDIDGTVISPDVSSIELNH